MRSQKKKKVNKNNALPKLSDGNGTQNGTRFGTQEMTRAVLTRKHGLNFVVFRNQFPKRVQGPT